MIFLFEVHVKPGYTAEQYAGARVRASRMIHSANGARSNRLHPKLDDDNLLSGQSKQYR
jgi:hypothetical protein